MQSQDSIPPSPLILTRHDTNPHSDRDPSAKPPRRELVSSALQRSAVPFVSLVFEAACNLRHGCRLLIRPGKTQTRAVPGGSAGRWSVPQSELIGSRELGDRLCSASGAGHRSRAMTCDIFLRLDLHSTERGPLCFLSRGAHGTWPNRSAATKLCSSFRGARKNGRLGVSDPWHSWRQEWLQVLCAHPPFSFSLCRRHMAAALPKAVHYRPLKCLLGRVYLPPTRARTNFAVMPRLTSRQAFRAKEIFDRRALIDQRATAGFRLAVLNS